MKNETIGKIIGVTVSVCFVSAFFVSTSAVMLKPRQELNKKLEKISNIVSLAGFEVPRGRSLKVFSEKISARIVDLEKGEAIPESMYRKGFSPDDFDLKFVNGKKGFYRMLKAGEDIAGIKKKPLYMPLFVLQEQGRIRKAILLVYGKGLWSTLYGFLALEADLRTIAGITFYEHGETPGLGGEVDNPLWKDGWKGKVALSEFGEVLLHVLKGKVNPASPKAASEVDGLSGATLTTRGVDNLVRFWLSENGYGRYLKKLGAQ